ncbi:MAG: rod-binding protein [Bdellovibrio sp.]|nr:rod-binding protein [Bdellovibrio sp.]
MSISIPPSHPSKRDSNGIEYIPKDYVAVAESQEANFLKLMFDEMHKSIEHAEDPSSAEDIYQSLLTDERAKALAAHPNGVGIKNLILDQIYPQKFRSKEAYEAYQAMVKGNGKPRE